MENLTATKTAAVKSCDLCRSKGEKCWGDACERPKCKNGITCCNGDCDLCLEKTDKCWWCTNTAVYANFNGDMTHCFECGIGNEDDHIISPHAFEWMKRDIECKKRQRLCLQSIHRQALSVL